MCGRYFIAPDDAELRALAEQMNRSPLLERFRAAGAKPAAPQGEIVPSAVVPVVASSRAGRQAVFPMKWGFSRDSEGRGGGLLINARTETAGEKAIFREAWTSHRCAVPASWYFEWEHPEGPDGKKHPGTRYAIRPEGDGLIWLAGLYRMEHGLPAFVILTRPASEDLRWMHDRMPLILPGEAIREWIRPEADPAALSGACLTRMASRAG